jgi:hypothetical protein
MKKGDIMIGKNKELVEIVTKFVESGWGVIEKPSKIWLETNEKDEFIENTKIKLIEAVEQADKECGICGCEFDPLYKKALVLLRSA